MSATNLLYKSLTTKIAPMVYIMMFVNVLIGFFFVTGLDMSMTESVLYGTGVLVHKVIWGGLLLFTATVSMIGMVWDKDALIQFGGIAGFMLWLFATIASFQAGHIYIVLTITLFHLLFHGYVYLASTQGVLRRTTMRE